MSTAKREKRGQEASVSPPETTSPRTKVPPQLKPWKPGQSGNPGGRPKIEPAVRKLARTYDRRMVEVLASIAEDKTVLPSERRKAAVALIEIGSGRAEFVQSVAGKDGQPLFGVSFNVGVGSAPGPVWDAHTAYRAMLSGSVAPNPDDPAFAARPALGAENTRELASNCNSECNLASETSAETQDLQGNEPLTTPVLRTGEDKK